MKYYNTVLIIVSQDNASEVFTKILITFTLQVWKNTKKLNKSYYTKVEKIIKQHHKN